MPEVWMPYGEVEVSLRLKHENYEGTVEPLKVDNYGEEIKDVVYYITDGKRESLDLLQKKFQQLRPLDYKPARETIIDGVLVKIPENIEKTVTVCSVRLDPVYGFTGPHSILAQLTDLQDEFLKRKEADLANDPSMNFAARILEETNPSAICYFGGSTQRVLTGSATEVFKRIQNTFLEKAVKPKKHKFIVASAGGCPYDDTLSDALISAYNLLPHMDNDCEVILAAECKNGLGDEGLRRLTLGLSSSSMATQILGKIKKQAHLSLVSSLPSTIISSLGISGYTSLSEAFEFIESRNSWKLKAWIPKETATLYAGETK